MFGRGKQQTPPAPTPVAEPASPARPGGKGRPTPSRREAEQRNRRPIVAGSTALPANATKEQKKAARQARRAQLNAERAQQRQALLTGDEAHLPARDRGPARRWVRAYVDARTSIGEFFLPIALVVLVLSVINHPTVKLISAGLLYAVMFTVAVDAFLLRRRLKAEVTKRFGDKDAGAAGYGMVRSLQFRKFRMPRPQTARGEYPS